MESIACVKEDEKMKFALEGIKVIDFSKWLPGQYCGMMLADYGADEIGRAHV